ncbi:MAG: AbrB/MazE/SpoVT family DNA-binding domain-containing protein [archaeon]
MKRRVIKQGNNTLTVTLPKSWTEENGVKPGQDIELEIKGNSVVLSTSSLRDGEKKEIDISELKSILPMLLLSLYRKGYDELRLSFDDAGVLVALEGILLTTGFTLVEHSSRHCVVRALADADNMQFSEMVRKLILLVKLKLDNLAEGLKGRSHRLESMIGLNQVPTLTNFCHRLMAKHRRDDVLHMHTLISSVESLDRQIRLLTEILMDNRCQVSGEADQMLQEFAMLFSEFYSGFLSATLEAIAPIMLKKRLVEERLSHLYGTDHSLLIGLSNSMVYFDAMVNSALLMVV